MLINFCLAELHGCGGRSYCLRRFSTAVMQRLQTMFLRWSVMTLLHTIATDSYLLVRADVKTSVGNVQYITCLISDNRLESACDDVAIVMSNRH